MARNKKKKQEDEERLGLFARLQDETKHGVLAVIFFVFAAFFILAAFNLAGVVGEHVYDWGWRLLGYGYIVLPLLLLLLGGSFLKEDRPDFALPTSVGAVFFLLSALGLVAIAGEDGGGMLGELVAAPLVTLFDTIATAIFLVAVVIISLLVMFDTRPTLEHLRDLLPERITLPQFRRQKADEVEVYGVGDEPSEEEEPYEESPGEECEEDDAEAEYDEEPSVTTAGEGEEHTDSAGGQIVGAQPAANIPYDPPPLSLLAAEKGKPGSGDIKANANIIKRTLQNFGVDVEMDEVSVGPSVTRYALKPAEGVRLSRIVSLQRDLELALAASPVRIEAPIPGKSLVGVEIPNTTRMTVGLKTMLSSDQYKNTHKPLLMAMGRGVSGDLQFADLAKMPHVLIAGATGSGKSVAIHSMISSLLYRNSPEMLRFIMVDPKRVELTLYNDIPHLLTPVITDPKKAIVALKWAVKEMDRRYDVLEAEKVRDISSYHENVVQPALEEAEEASDDEESAGEELPERMPYIVIVIDELADIMAMYPRELESAIVRLAQMSRAVGIHLMLSTQRPSVNVITGLIKANIPARVALQVASQIDSRTILDAGGAEKLLGAGDMLYLSGEMAKPQRLQSAFISEQELKKVAKHLAKQDGDAWEHIEFSDPKSGNSLFDTALGDDGDGEDEQDELYEQAREIVIHSRKASTSYLQRRLKVGYARAARIIDMLEERGVVGPQEGSKPRDILEEKPQGADERAVEESQSHEHEEDEYPES